MMADFSKSKCVKTGSECCSTWQRLLGPVAPERMSGELNYWRDPKHRIGRPRMGLPLKFCFAISMQILFKILQKSQLYQFMHTGDCETMIIAVILSFPVAILNFIGRGRRLGTWWRQRLLWRAKASNLGTPHSGKPWWRLLRLFCPLLPQLPLPPFVCRPLLWFWSAQSPHRRSLLAHPPWIPRDASARQAVDSFPAWVGALCF